MRLRDMTKQTESERRDEIKTLEEDLPELSTVKDYYKVVKEKLA